MDIETAANPAGGDVTQPVAADASTPEAQAPAGGATQETEALSPDIAADQVATEDDEYEEVERGDKKYRIPKPLKGELLMHQDYTRKTMELAEQRRALEAAQAAVQQAQKLSTDEIRAFAKLETLNEQVQQYEAVDWDVLEQNDPTEAARHFRLYQSALNQRTQVQSALREHMAGKQAQAQQEAAKRRQDVEAAVAKEIPNWATRRPEIEKFAAQHGFAPEALTETADVRDLKILNYAYEGFKFIERQKAAARTAAQSAIKPAQEVGGTAAAGLDPNSMSFEQYKAAREAGHI